MRRPTPARSLSPGIGHDVNFTADGRRLPVAMLLEGRAKPQYLIACWTPRPVNQLENSETAGRVAPRAADAVGIQAIEAFPRLEPGMFKGSAIEIEYKKLSPTPDRFDGFVKRVVQAAIQPYDFGADTLKATKAPMLFIHGDADGVRLDHIVEMFRLKGGDIHGDLRARSESRLAILPNASHVTLMERVDVIVPMVNDFLNAQPQRM